MARYKPYNLKQDKMIPLGWAKDTRSELQLRDARNLIASVDALDWEYIERWATDLGVSDLLTEVRT